MRIIVDDLSGLEIAEFLEEHIKEMAAITPPESMHALDIDGLRKPDVTFWSVVDGETLVGCGAIKELDASHVEIKSMRTAPSHKNRGVASRLLQHMIAEVRERGCPRLSLETGSTDFFAPARGLYEKHGFEYCEPFAAYQEDPNSVFMTKLL